MSYVKHEHNDNCDRSNFSEWLSHIAPDLFFYDVQDVGSYQGSVYGVGRRGKELFVYEDYYGSCSGCGAWGEGGEPDSQSEVESRCSFFTDLEDAFAYLDKMEKYNNPDIEGLKKALKEADMGC